MPVDKTLDESSYHFYGDTGIMYVYCKGKCLKRMRVPKAKIKLMRADLDVAVEKHKEKENA